MGDEVENTSVENTKPYYSAGIGVQHHYPADLATQIENGIGYINFFIKERRNRAVQTHVFLPLPQGFSISDSAEYSKNFEKSDIQQGLTGAANIIKNIRDGKAFSGPNASSSVVADAAVTGLLFGGGLPLIGDKFNEVAFQAGAAINKGERTKFEANATRTFSFSFKFSPKNEKEGATIKKIIDLFRTYTYASLGSNALALNYPPEFLIKFMHKGKESKFMPILLPSHLESVKVDYNPDTRALLPDGSPVTYAIDLQFAEVKKLVREEVVALERGIDDAARHETMYQNQYITDIEEYLNAKPIETTDEDTV
tara:strand:+ start:44 stop:976 length:933 start_codon:yes stop_codon:yes gene_type:complete